MNYYLFSRAILPAVPKKNLKLIYDCIDKRDKRFHFEVEV